MSIIKSKQICPNIISKYVWDLKEVRKDWDGMILRSWVRNDQADKILYQEAFLSSIMTPEYLMEFVKNKMGEKNLKGVVIYSGTIPILAERVHFSHYFEVELYDPKTGRRLGCSYKINVLSYLKG